MGHSKTIEEIENKYWGNPPNDSTTLIRTVYKVRKKPIDMLTIEDIRISIGQNESLDILIPVAMDYLRKDLFAHGDFYPGDLLLNVLRADKMYWANHEHSKSELIGLYKEGINAMDDLVYADEIKNDITTAYSIFVR